MAFEAILDEVDQLHNVSTRLEGLAEQHPPVEEALMRSREKFAARRWYWLFSWRPSCRALMETLLEPSHPGQELSGQLRVSAFGPIRRQLRLTELPTKLVSLFDAATADSAEPSSCGFPRPLTLGRKPCGNGHFRRIVLHFICCQQKKCAVCAFIICIGAHYSAQASLK
jgi:hypothetical protein